jgi:hypothetical protein
VSIFAHSGLRIAEAISASEQHPLSLLDGIFGLSGDGGVLGANLRPEMQRKPPFTEVASPAEVTV